MIASKIVQAIVDKAALPVSRNTFLPEDLLTIINEEMELNIVPELMRTKEDYLLFDEVVTTVVGKNSYLIPYRAVAGKLRDVGLVDTNGRLTPMSRTTISERYLSDIDFSRLNRYFIKNNSIVLLGNHSGTNSGDNLSLVYYIKPNKLVLETRCGFITDVEFGIDITGVADATKVTFVLDQLPGNMASGKLDLLKGTPVYQMVKYDMTPTAVNQGSSKVEFLLTDVEKLPVEFDVGDYFASAQECCIPQIPEEMHTMLTHVAAARVMEELGDQQGLANANAKVAQYSKSLFNMTSDRVEDSPLKIIPNHGLLRNRRNVRGRF